MDDTDWLQALLQLGGPIHPLLLVSSSWSITMGGKLGSTVETRAGCGLWARPYPLGAAVGSKGSSQRMGVSVG